MRRRQILSSAILSLVPLPQSAPQRSIPLPSDFPAPRFQLGQSVAYEFSGDNGKTLRAEGDVIGLIYPSQCIDTELFEWGYFIAWTGANYPEQFMDEIEEFPESMLIANPSAAGGAE